jgi:hypothetical protein
MQSLPICSSDDTDRMPPSPRAQMLAVTSCKVVDPRKVVDPPLRVTSSVRGPDGRL